MSGPEGKPPGGLRLGIMVVLAVAAVLLYYLETRSEEAGARGAEPVSPSARNGVQAIVDSMLRQYGIPRSSVRTWNILSLDKKPIRVAQQVEVSRAFPTLVFNAQMQRLLEPIEAHVFATERSRDNIVTMHIVWHGRTIRSLTLSLTRKEGGETGRVSGRQGRNYPAGAARRGSLVVRATDPEAYGNDA